MKRFVQGLPLGLLTLMTATVVSAQTEPEVGGTLAGELTLQSTKVDGRPTDCIPVNTRSGQNYEATLRSPDFDALLAAGEGTSCAAPAQVEDDDGAGSTNARIRYVGTGRPWFIRAGSLNAGALGRYELSVWPRFGDAPRMDIGETATGRLDGDDLEDTSGVKFDCIPIRALINQGVQIDLRSSVFDPRLTLHRGADCLGAVLAEDDDGGGGVNARISARLPATGEYAVRATIFGVDEGGAYTLSITDPNSATRGSALWREVQTAAGCGYARGSRRFTPITFKAAPVTLGGGRRLDGVVIVDGIERTREDAGLTFAEGRPWFEGHGVISVSGRTYEKYGLPRLIEAGELAFFTEHDGVAVATAAGDEVRDVIYVHVDGFECSFQPYQVQS